MRSHTHETTVRSDRENVSGTSYGGNCGPTCIAREHHVLARKSVTLSGEICSSRRVRYVYTVPHHETLILPRASPNSLEIISPYRKDRRIINISSIFSNFSLTFLYII